MAMYKCKMCGGQLEIEEGISFCTCEYCGTQQTLPTVKEEGLQGLFNRANVLRMKSEFDKAAEIYEKILQANESEAEAYWGLILCKYGIEYVEDPQTYKRVPTCHRTSYDAITADEDYKSAIQHADAEQKAIYEAEAKAIDEIQKGILAISQKEDAFDVFICYKETDENGSRTIDSVIANDIYYQLTQEGFKVFYAAITLEDKLGKEYEPYIFAALNTSKVMLSLGTKPEYFNAVWVKNEWSRFLKLMKKDRSKMLIPCYRDMDAYELPEEFAHLQAQDMSKIGFINDLVRGIKKVITKEEAKATEKVVEVQQAAPVNSNVVAQLKRGNMALEDGEWEKADVFFEEVLNQDAECGDAYWGKYLASQKVRNTEEFVNFFKDKESYEEKVKLVAVEEAKEHIEEIVRQYRIDYYLTENIICKLYQYDRSYLSEVSLRKERKASTIKTIESDKLCIRAKQYAGNELMKEIDGAVESIVHSFDDMIEKSQAQDSETAEKIKQAYEKHIKEADQKAKELYDKACENRENDYLSYVKRFENADSINDFDNLKKHFRNMNDYKEAAEYAKKCDARIAEINRKIEEERERQEVLRKKEATRQRRKKKIIAAALFLSAIAVVTGYLVVTKVVIPNQKYNAAIELMEAEKYEEVIVAFEAMEGYKESEQKIEECKILIISNAKAGDTIVYGNNNCEWIVLAREDEKILVLRKYAKCEKAYDEKYRTVLWENCSLRKWLNGSYLNDEFSAEEQKRIVISKITKYGTRGGNDTTDKVFLLSIDEVEKYLTSNEIRQCTLSDGTSVWWWLRYLDNSSKDAASVNYDGSVLEHGDHVHYEIGAVRPALWIDISNP